MKTVASCLLGFVVGWSLRALFDSRRDALVSLTAAAYGAAAMARRLAGFEREYLEDVIAEGKARWEAERRCRAERAAAPAPADGSNDGEGSR
jgi:hypothetical protein